MNILALGAHLDDVESGAGATLAKMADRGDKITYVGYSWCDNKELSSECQRAIQILGFSDLNIYNYQVRRFNEARQEILDNMISLRDKINPDIVFTHSSYDTHQDHKVIYQESFRAFKGVTLLGYDMPWNCLESYLTCPSEITQDHLNRKLSAIQQYESQKDRPYSDPEFIKGLARVRGVQFKVQFAEAFETIKISI